MRMCVSSLQNIVGWCDAQEFSQVQYLEWTASGLGRVAFQVYRTKKKQANSSPSLLRLLSTSPLPIFRVSPTICLSDVLPCLMPITKYAIVGARDPTARKRCRKLQRAPLGLTCRFCFYGAQTRDGAPSVGRFSGDEEQDAKFPGKFKFSWPKE